MLAKYENKLARLGPEMYALMLHYDLFGPEAEMTRMPGDWQKIYKSRFYHWNDPVVRWISDVTEKSVTRWSEIDSKDPRRIFEKAKDYGMNFGAVAVTSTDKGKCFVSVSRRDRELTDHELIELSNLLDRATYEYYNCPVLTEAEMHAIKFLANDQLIAEAAKSLGVTEGTVKMRLKRAKKRLGVKTNNGLIGICYRNGLLN